MWYRTSDISGQSAEETTRGRKGVSYERRACLSGSNNLCHRVKKERVEGKEDALNEVG